MGSPRGSGKLGSPGQSISFRGHRPPASCRKWLTHAFNQQNRTLSIKFAVSKPGTDPTPHRSRHCYIWPSTHLLSVSKLIYTYDPYGKWINCSCQVLSKENISNWGCTQSVTVDSVRNPRPHTHMTSSWGHSGEAETIGSLNLIILHFSGDKWCCLFLKRPFLFPSYVNWININENQVMHLSFKFFNPVDSKLWVWGTNENTRMRPDRCVEVAQTEAQNSGSQM